MSDDARADLYGCLFYAACAVPFVLAVLALKGILP